jgi:hypothetical protein
MPEYDLTEKDYKAALRAALAIDAIGEALDALTGLAVRLLERDETQEAANLILFVRNHPDVRHDTFDAVDELYLYLESSACPRCLEDAQAFVLGKTINTVANHVLSAE